VKGLSVTPIFNLFSAAACQVLNDKLQDDSEPPKKKLYLLKIELVDEIGWRHVAAYERQWMHVRFPAALPLF
jgi:tripeptidyl-peptidase II